MKGLSESQLLIDLKALRENYEVLKQHLQSSTKIMGVVKNLAYGTDAIVISQALVGLGVSYLAVAYLEEGVRLRKAGIRCPILVFYPKKTDLSHLIKYNLIPSVYNMDYLIFIFKKLKKMKVNNFPIHLKINTGMNRLGFEEGEFDKVAEYFNKDNPLCISGIFSHLAASSLDKEKEFTIQQIKKFKEAVIFFEPYSNKDCLSHLCNSSGIFNYADAEMDMVRTGIALYGYGNTAFENKQLTPIASLQSPIIQLRWIQKGESVGYDRKYVATQHTQIATVNLGYADGISRIYGNGNSIVRVNDKKAPIIGNICMDCLMIDVTNIGCKVGDAVVFFDKEHTVLDFDTHQLSIPYELITRISQRVKRVIVS